jgi:hypothetical protein
MAVPHVMLAHRDRLARMIERLRQSRLRRFLFCRIGSLRSAARTERALPAVYGDRCAEEQSW